MTGSLAHRAETLRLARVLGVEPAELDFLAAAPVEALAELRATVLDRLLDRSRQEFERAVALGDKVPRGLAATLAQRAMGPVLGGRAAALISADMAADLAARLPAEFLADVAAHVDLRHVGPLIGGIPLDTMAAAGRVLREREEWIVLAAFVGDVPEEKLEVLLTGFDAEALLRAGFVIDDVTRLDTAIALLPDARLDELFAVAHQHALWPEAMSLACHIGAEQAGRIVAAVDRQPDDYLDALLVAAHEHGLWREAITVAAHLPEASGGAILRAIERLAPERLDELLAGAHEHALWPQVIRVTVRAAGDGSGSGGTVIGAGLGRLTAAQLDDLTAAADAEGLWAEVVTLAVRLGEDGGEPLITAIERLDSAQQERLAAILNERGELRAAAGALIARAPAHLQHLVQIPS
ncbi:hypothetical protein DSM112329_03355 [Paraconexibacter sp. AEG42_29]|uniref:DUF2336 domain-containing protein n=1 Tax=Paraconexibacter sp. AEG42_29 TaxID=2997339 RepID=A0AAU7AXZ8_9ACTN